MRTQVLSVVAQATARQPTTNREWSSMKVKISTWPISMSHLVASACQSSLGSSAQKRIQDERGRFFGSCTTSPSRLRMRQIVETDGIS